MPQEQTPENIYRRDIDGMRAIAVMLVLFYHAFPNLVTGGFIGVDVFFVISGFLITKLIAQELQSNNFNFCIFWAKRIRRIAPSLITVLCLTFIFGYTVMTADELKNLAAHIKSATIFLSNFQLRRETGYFESSADSKPLLHLWSLAIEEQFYILWPATLYLILRLRSNALRALVVLIVLSFCANLSEAAHNPSKAFFYPHTRFWELMAGGAIAWRDVFNFNSKARPVSLRSTFNDIFSSAALILLLLTALVLDRSVLYPGYWALIPIVSTVILISTVHRSNVTHRLLSNRFLVLLGLISYPLYLWHWPILTFLKLLSPHHGAILTLAALILAMLLSLATWRFIEKPCRQVTNLKFVVTALSILLLVLFALGDFIARKEGLRNRTHIADLERAFVSISEPKKTRISDGSCKRFDKLNIPSGVQCLTNSSEPTTLILGDSHALALNSAAHLGMIEMKTIAIAVHGCTPLQGYQLLSRNSGTTPPLPIQGCPELTSTVETALSLIPSIKKIIIATRGDNFYASHRAIGSDYAIQPLAPSNENAPEMYISGYLNFVRILAAYTKEITFFLGIPPLDSKPADCIGSRPLSFNLSKRSYCETSLEAISKNREFNLYLAERIKQEFGGTKIFDPIDIFCDQVTCFGFREKQMLYFDSTHMSIQASKISLERIVID